jgi:alcohol dehydrogenase (NADP+)
MYDPLRTYGATQGKKMTIGVIGVGGLGTMGIKLAKALGHKVIAVSTSESKR